MARMEHGPESSVLYIVDLIMWLGKMEGVVSRLIMKLSTSYRAT